MHPKPVQTRSALLPSDQNILKTCLNRNHLSLVVLQGKRDLSHCSEKSVGAVRCRGSSGAVNRLLGAMFWKRCVHSPSQVESRVAKLFPMLQVHWDSMPCRKGIRWRAIEQVTWPSLAYTGSTWVLQTHILTCMYTTHTGKKLDNCVLSFLPATDSKRETSWSLDWGRTRDKPGLQWAMFHATTVAS